MMMMMIVWGSMKGLEMGLGFECERVCALRCVALHYCFASFFGG